MSFEFVSTVINDKLFCYAVLTVKSVESKSKDFIFLFDVSGADQIDVIISW